ncbi:MAG: serine hydrolase [Clostridia bacterium]|nr:serine hydrolase [Clostridia bacterium]MDD4387196.1 serine hydrolase [Clostridia bacterium]
MYKRILFIFLFITLYIINYNFIYGKFDGITENSAIVLDSDGLSILYNKNMNKKIFPASTTKILTAILAIENLNLDSNVTVSNEALANVPYGSSIIYLKQGEILTVRQLLYGLLLSSGSDAANVLAEAISGSIENFEILMNKKLELLGCINSHFVNPHGFHNDNHYSTAYDMAMIMRYASQNDTFRTICETKEYVIEETNKTLVPRKLENTDLLLSYKLNYVIGGKTGYTAEAGNVFVCYSSLNGNNIVCCVFDGLKNIMSKKTRFIDTKMLLDNSFKNFDKTKIIDKDTFKISYIDKKSNKNYILGIDKDIYCLTDKNAYIINYTLSDILINDKVVNGKIYICAKNDNWQANNIYEIKLIEIKVYTDNHNNSNIYLLYILFILIVLVIILLIIKITLNKNSKLMRRKNNLG